MCERNRTEPIRAKLNKNKDLQTMETTILIYHETKYDLSVYADVVRYYRHFKRNNNTMRKISDLIESGVFAYCKYNDVYFHLRSCPSARVFSIADNWIYKYYIGTYNQYGARYRYCSYTERHYFTSEVTFISLANGGYVADDYLSEIFSYGDNHFLTENELEDWKQSNIRFVSAYHSDGVKEYPFDDIKPERFRVGFEAEKEDVMVRNSMSITEFKQWTDGVWKKENDSSLDSRSGFELISPVMDLNIERIERYLQSNDIIMQHINAKYNLHSCGGHITISDVEQDGFSLFDSISGYVPVLYSMYGNRINNTYSQAQKKEELRRGSRSALCVKDNRVEIRIFSAIRDYDILIFRLKLIRFFLDNMTDSPSEAIKNLRQNSDLFNGIYNRETLARMLRRAEFYGEEFNFSDVRPYSELA